MLGNKFESLKSTKRSRARENETRERVRGRDREKKEWQSQEQRVSFKLCVNDVHKQLPHERGALCEIQEVRNSYIDFLVDTQTERAEQ